MISVKELAKALGVSSKTIYALCERDDIPCYRIGTGRGTLRFDLDEVKQALRPHKPAVSKHSDSLGRHLF
ncbi:helix-turn-helix domain-containing protein [Rhodopirellula baltica]|uniref:Protein containing Excisionase/Xis, DNA-binding domain protein n=1 Tax=Rhodopirellula baltica SWK14 TaxID=993516 RepID=L7CDY4_RHOBT|nr:protein containing Excisionase/Xis, DNA-binding domain protein [Rhodopirellula baltica SWK14]